MNIDYHALLPVEILASSILVVLVVDLFLPARAKSVSMWVAMVGVLASLAAVLSLVGQGERVAFGGAYVVDAFTLIFQAFFLLCAVVVLLISYRYLRDGGFYQGEYYFLLLTAFLGCTLMPASRNLLMLFLALELVSAPGFLMSAFRKSDIRGNEGGLKFFIIGVLSTAVMLYGMSLIYGLTGCARAARDRRQARRADRAERDAGAGGDPVRGGRVRVQGLGRAVPVLGAGHLRGLARAGRRVPGGGLGGRRVRGPAAADVRGVRRASGSSGRRSSRCCRC